MGPMRNWIAPQYVSVGGAADIAPAKAGFTPVIFGWGLKTAGKFQSNAATDLTGTLPDGYVMYAEYGMPLLVGQDSLKINLTGGTGFVIFGYFKTPTISNPSF